MAKDQSQSELADLPVFKELTAREFLPKIRRALQDYAIVIMQVKATKDFSWESCIQPLEETAERLGKIWGLLEHLNSVTKTRSIRNAYEELLPLITNFHTEVLHDKKLFELFVQYRDSKEFSELSEAQQTIINNDIRDFNLSGVDLREEERNKYKGYVESLNELENTFTNNVLDSTEAWTYYVAPEDASKIAGLPEHTLLYANELARDQKLQGWVFTLDYPCYHAIMSCCENREFRDLCYRAYNTRGTAPEFDNTEIIAGILKLRRNVARIIGYKTYAQYSLIPKTADSVQEVNKFLLDLSAKVIPRARDEYANLIAYARNCGLSGELGAGDFTFYEEMMRKEQYHISEEELRAYFPEPRVLTGMFKLVRQLFGLSITEIADFDSWHKNVRLFCVSDKNGKVRGYFYIDLYTRTGKQGGAWMSECASRVRFSNDYLQKPVAFLNCNFAPPTRNRPGLLSHDEVITLFHEFGHTLHHVLTKVDFFSVSGMNGVAWDAIELPSQFLENFCWEWLVIQDISENLYTGEPMPREMFNCLIASKNFHAGLRMLRQIEYSLFDMRIHGDSQESAHEILQNVRREISVVPVPEYNRYENSFTHIFGGGYAAGYYSYLWAEVLSCDAFDKFKENGLINPELGQSFLENILEQGGSKAAMDLFIAFAGRKPVTDALLRNHGII